MLTKLSYKYKTATNIKNIIIYDLNFNKLNGITKILYFAINYNKIKYQRLKKITVQLTKLSIKE